MRHLGDDDGSDTVTVKATALKQTAKALLVRVGEKEAWVPKSVIHDDSEVYEAASGEGKLIVQGWWGRKEGLG